MHYYSSSCTSEKNYGLTRTFPCHAHAHALKHSHLFTPLPLSYLIHCLPRFLLLFFSPGQAPLFTSVFKYENRGEQLHLFFFFRCNTYRKSESSQHCIFSTTSFVFFQPIKLISVVHLSSFPCNSLSFSMYISCKSLSACFLDDSLPAHLS
jgi:hypothetical protein